MANANDINGNQNVLNQVGSSAYTAGTMQYRYEPASDKQKEALLVPPASHGSHAVGP